METSRSFRTVRVLHRKNFNPRKHYGWEHVPVGYSTLTQMPGLARALGYTVPVVTTEGVIHVQPQDLLSQAVST